MKEEKQGISMSYLWKFLLQLLIVCVSVVLGSYLADNFRLIPIWLLYLPEVDFSVADILTNTKIFLAFCGGAFLIGRLILGWDVFATSRRTAQEVYVFLVGIVAASLYLFIFTTVNFSPELLLDTSVITILLFGVAYLFLGSDENAGAGSRLWALVKDLFGLLKKPAVWAVLLFALSPLVLAAKFLSDRDFANWVTEKRISANLNHEYPYQLKPILADTTFLQPIMVRFAPGNDETIYVLERSGSIYSLDYPAGTNKQLVIDQTEQVGYVEMENGALGFDFHPDFNGAESKPYLYLYYTSYLEDSQTNYLSRFDVSQPDAASRANSELKLIEQNRSNDGYHNAGSVEFGPDGFLYLSVGEAAAEDCHQRIDCSLVGGILRIDVNETGGDVSHPAPRQPLNGTTANYYIPNDNPYVGTADALEEFWAHGLRNSFRIAFDKETGDLWAGDVGSTVWEEVNLIVKGGNYEYPHKEGVSPTDIPMPAELVGEVKEPVYTYQHTALLRAVIGGPVYRGAEFPELQGMHLFGDNYSGEVFALKSNGESVEADQVERIARSPLVAQAGITSLVHGPDGEILATALGGFSAPTGLVFRMVGGDEEFSSAAVALAANTDGEVTMAEAESLFKTNCARCHGSNGMADGPDSDKLGIVIPSFHTAEFHESRSAEDILVAIQKGGMGVGKSAIMPPWESILSENQMIAIRDYILTMKP